MSQHHDGTEEESSWIGQTLASNVRCGTVDSLEDGALITNVARWRQTKTSDETSAHVGENVTVKVGHDQDLVVVWSWVGDDLQASVVQKLGIELNGWEVLANVAGGVQEESIGHLHDGSLVNCADLKSVDVLGVLEGESQNTLTGVLSDELDALNDTVNDDVLNTRILSLGVLTDQDGVDVVVWSLVTGNRAAWADVGKEVEGTAKSKVEGNVTLSNWCLHLSIQVCLKGRYYTNSKRTLKSDLVPFDTLNCLVGNDSLAILEARSHIYWLPLDWCLHIRLDSCFSRHIRIVKPLLPRRCP